jgi:2,3-bisphosphoglycerate-independent phosphoglycerate mutase
LSRAFVLKNFSAFQRPRQIQNLFFVTMTEYEAGLPAKVVFLPRQIDNPLAKILSDQGLKQFHIAETEKYAHVTFFFNGGYDHAVNGEERIMIPSLKIRSYDQEPKMSAGEITSYVLERLDQYDFMAINFANPDMLGHTGNLEAARRGIEYIDQCLVKIVDQILARDGLALITADHGNAEEMLNLKTGEIDTQHSTNPVPFILVSERFKDKKLRQGGILADVAPTILDVLAVDKPNEMTGKTLLM